MRRAVVALVLAGALPVLGGCAAWPLTGPARVLLDRGDAAVVGADYAAALAAYEEVVASHPGTRAAVRARVSRDAVVEIVRLRHILATRETEMTRLREELARTRQDLAGRQAELTRLTAEADRLREDLEKLKQIDLRLEKQRRP
ncbi:MAG: hypothetical protein ACREJG_06000 [Candidatus Rokuibacteriota bacterium]